MLTRRLLIQGAVLGFCSVPSITQTSPAPSSTVLRQFPLVLQQNVESGKTRIGTKVQAKLAVATLFRGVVIPRNAMFSGVVIESTAKSAEDQAKLAIRMEKAEWKDGSTSMKAYLTPLYYAPTIQAAQSLPDQSEDPNSRTFDGQQSQSPMQRPFPANDSQASQSTIPATPTASGRPVPIKNVAFALADEGGAALVSPHSNIKLFKLTTYVFAVADRAGK